MLLKESTLSTCQKRRKNVLDFARLFRSKLHFSMYCTSSDRRATSGKNYKLNACTGCDIVHWETFLGKSVF